MFSRFRIAARVALLLTLLTSSTALAKGGFSFISITGSELKEPIRISDRELTESFFAFADFSRDGTEAPADPGVGYEITRYYVEGSRESAFDKLHYYPETGFVYYDGIVNGSSEYDKKWYTAKPDLKTIFENALFTQRRLVDLGNPESAQALVPPQAIPFKGQVLTQLARWWFDRTADLCPNHVLDYPHPNVVVGKRLTILPVEVVVRGYLVGTTSTSILTQYRKGIREMYGHSLPDGMRDNQALPHAIIDPHLEGF